jgi:dipeptidyl aminopeptidase/acylaminoacyl peptidase
MTQQEHPSDSPEHVQPRDMLQKTIVYEVPGMQQVNVRKDVPYKKVDEQDLTLDVYYPLDFDQDMPLPAVLFVHGDAPPDFLAHAKDWGQYVSWGQLIAASGLIAVTFNHRSTQSLIKLDDAASDVNDLLAFVNKHASDLGIDASMLGIWTCSGGAMIGLQTAFQWASSAIRCVIVYYGATDLQAFFDQPTDISENLEQSEHTLPLLPPTTFEKFSASTSIKGLVDREMPLLVARAGLDAPALNASIDRLVVAALSSNANLVLMNHAKGRHAFDVVDDDERTREIIHTTLEFVKMHLK